MGDPLRILPEEICTRASCLGTLSERARQVQDTLAHSWSRLDSGWEDYAESGIQAGYHDAMKELSHMVAMLEQMDQALVQSAACIEAADKNATTLFGKSLEENLQGIGGAGKPLARMVPQGEADETPDFLERLMNFLAGKGWRTDEEYEATLYGFEFIGLTEEQTQTLLVTLEAYAGMVGGQEQLRALMMAANNGELRNITFDPNLIGANAGINLGPTSFDRDLAKQNNYADYGADSNEKRAQIVLGHEIAHNLFAVLRSDQDWAVEYMNRIERGDGQAWTDAAEAEQEATTNLALYVLSEDYSWNTFTSGEDAEDSDRQLIVEQWAQDFLDALSQQDAP
ncbi:MAG: WXG100 family type VII secretion target [Chloroflexota bacterium]